MKQWPWFVSGVGAIGLGLVIWPLIAPGLVAGLILLGIGFLKLVKGRHVHQSPVADGKIPDS